MYQVVSVIFLQVSSRKNILLKLIILNILQLGDFADVRAKKVKNKISKN